MEQVKQFKKYAYLALMFAPLVVSLFVVWFLPETIVSRMDLAGNVTATASRFSIFLFPILVAILGFAIRIASSSPKLTGGNVRTARSISWILLLLLNVIAYFQFSLYLGGMTAGAQMSRFITFILGVFFILIGNLAPKIKENSKHFGFRASWLKNNDAAFRKTQRFFGFASMICGIIFILISLFVTNQLAMILVSSVLLLTIGITIVYSYKISK